MIITEYDMKNRNVMPPCRRLLRHGEDVAKEPGQRRHYNSEAKEFEEKCKAARKNPNSVKSLMTRARNRGEHLTVDEAIERVGKGRRGRPQNRSDNWWGGDL